MPLISHSPNGVLTLGMSRFSLPITVGTTSSPPRHPLNGVVDVFNDTLPHFVDFGGLLLPVAAKLLSPALLRLLLLLELPSPPWRPVVRCCRRCWQSVGLYSPSWETFVWYRGFPPKILPRPSWYCCGTVQRIPSKPQVSGNKQHPFKIFPALTRTKQRYRIGLKWHKRIIPGH